MKKYNSLLHGTRQEWDNSRKCFMGGGGSSGGGGGTSTTTQNIPDELKPLATQYTTDAIALSKQPYTPYGGQRYTDFNSAQNTGLDMVQKRAMNGSATVDNAEQNLNQMMSGGANPYLDKMYGRAAEQVQNSVNSNFSAAGRYGSGAQTDVLSQNLGDMATQMYGGAYENDQNRRMAAIGMAPQFGNMEYQDASQLLNAGQIMQDQTQKPMDFQYQQFQEQQNDPYKKLAAMSGVFGSNLGGSSTTQTQQSGGGGGK